MNQREIEAEALTLAHGADRCDILAHVGGSIGAWSVGGQPMLRAASAAGIAARDPFRMASFPLVPYSNRIGNANFEWDGRHIALARNFPPEPHAIHGVGFERPWVCSARTADSVLLTLFHQPDENWPWAFEARQRITIADRELMLDLTAINLAPRPVPLGFGHHPYFPQSGARLAFRARGVWLVGDDGLPSERVKPSGRFDFSQATPVDQAEVDHCFTGWTGPARIAWPGKPLELDVSGSWTLPSAVVCIRNGADGFCFEPVPHINNALNMPEREPAMPIIAPGKAFSATVRFRAVMR
jgi:aldose 1-epimerase